MFAFGVILLETVFNRKLFTLNMVSFKQVYTEGDVRRRVMEVVEGLELCRMGVIGRFLLQVGLRCLEPDPIMRPCFDWIGIILKTMRNSLAID